MRGVNIPHKPILGALAVGTILVVSALVVGRSEVEQNGDSQLAVVTKAPERNYVQVEDKDGNGIADWQDALVRIQPLPQTSASTSDWQPKTLTESFTVMFLENYVRNKSYGTLARDQESFVDISADALAEKALDRKIERIEITVIEQNDTETLRAYGNGIIHIMNKYPAPPKPEMKVLEDAVRANNPQKLEALQPILNSYRGMIVDMKLIPVPSSYVEEHLALLNAYQSVANDIDASTKTFSDPAYSLVRVKRYLPDVTKMSESVVAIFNKLTTIDEVPFTKNDEFYAILPQNI